MNKYNFIFLLVCLLAFLSCKNEAKNSKYIYYKNGNVAQKIIDIGNNKLNIINYYESGDIESRGFVVNGKKVGWWITYKNKKVINKYQFIVLKNKEYFNQTITYDNKGRIIDDKSDYFLFNIPDTLKIGKTKINIYYNPLYSNSSDVFVCIGYDINKDFSNLKKIRIDTFYTENPKNRWFGLRYESPGKKIVRGFIYERNIEIKHNLANKDSSAMIIDYHQKYFEKEIYVKR